MSTKRRQDYFSALKKKSIYKKVINMRNKKEVLNSINKFYNAMHKSIFIFFFFFFFFFDELTGIFYKVKQLKEKESKDS